MTAVAAPPASDPSAPAAAAAAAPPPADGAAAKAPSNEEEPPKDEEPPKAKQGGRKARLRAFLRRNAVPILLAAPYLLGLAWTLLHPLVSVVTGELKCRGMYVDENGLDVHRHRVGRYPLERAKISRTDSRTGSSGGTAGSGGMCDAVEAGKRAGILSPAVECLRHRATSRASFDLVRVRPAVGPVRDPPEAVALVVGGTRAGKNEIEGDGKGDWYEGSDLNASILHLIRRLGDKKEAPWLAKAVYVASPAPHDAADGSANEGNGDGGTVPLGETVDAFVASYVGPSGGGRGGDAAARPLPPSWTGPLLRALLVLNDAEPSAAATTTTTEVRVLPQGTGGALPNLDLVFATYLSFQSHPANGYHRGYGNKDLSLFYGDSVFRAHPYGEKLEGYVERLVTGALGGQVERTRLALKELDLDEKAGVGREALERYAGDLAGMAGFVGGMALGPRQPHAAALERGVDALTVEVRVPFRGTDRTDASSVHPHHADLVRCVEHLLRALSNLHERLHHSVAQYVLPSPSKFVSHGEYVYPGILVAFPPIVRAYVLLLRDFGGRGRRFRFAYVGTVLGSVLAGTLVVGLWAARANKGEEEDGPGRGAGLAFGAAYLLVLAAARRVRDPPPGGRKGGAEADPPTKPAGTPDDDGNDRRDGLRLAACFLAAYLHAPLLLANYSLALPSAAFWSPLLATSAPTTLRQRLSKSMTLSTLVRAVGCLFLLATLPPVLLVPRVFDRYTPYVLGVYTPLHLLLAAIWLARASG